MDGKTTGHGNGHGDGDGRKGGSYGGSEKRRSDFISTEDGVRVVSVGHVRFSDGTKEGGKDVGGKSLTEAEV